MTRARLALVCYSFYPAYQARLLRTVRLFLAGQRESVVVMVRSAQAPSCLAALVACGAQAIEIETDGSGWEFGAYQRGLDALLGLGWAGAVTILNDTAGIHYALRRGEIAALRQFALDPPTQSPDIMGPVQAAPGLFKYRDLDLPAWVRSNAFTLSPAALQVLQQRLFSAEDFEAPLITAQGLELPQTLSPALRQYVRVWLMASGRHGWRQHAGRADPPLPLLRDKAGSILLEMRLAARVLAAGGQLHNSTPRAHPAWQFVCERAFYLRRRFGPWRSARRSDRHAA